MPNILSVEQFDREFISTLFSRALNIEKRMNSGFGLDKINLAHLNHHTAILFFFEPSSRTFMSFFKASLNLGMNVIPVQNAGAASSFAKGESDHDTAKTINQYSGQWNERPDTVLIVRHRHRGGVVRMAEMSEVPIINAGDGNGEHPTQALLDLFQMSKNFPSSDGMLPALSGVTIAFIGDPKNSRVIRSNAKLIAQLYEDPNITFMFVSPKLLRMEEDILDYVRGRGIKIVVTNSIREAFKNADLLYMTRLQIERLHPLARMLINIPYIHSRVIQPYTIGHRDLDLIKLGATIMHPLPRVEGKNCELDPMIDNNPHAKYWETVRGSVPLRMALIEYCLGL